MNIGREPRGAGDVVRRGSEGSSQGLNPQGQGFPPDTPDRVSETEARTHRGGPVLSGAHSVLALDCHNTVEDEGEENRPVALLVFRLSGARCWGVGGTRKRLAR